MRDSPYIGVALRYDLRLHAVGRAANDISGAHPCDDGVALDEAEGAGGERAHWDDAVALRPHSGVGDAVAVERLSLERAIRSPDLDVELQDGGATGVWLDPVQAN